MINMFNLINGALLQLNDKHKIYNKVELLMKLVMTVFTKREAHAGIIMINSPISYSVLPHLIDGLKEASSFLCDIAR